MLADLPRVGKTGAAIMAADYVFARRILVVTTASGRAVWRRAFPQWSQMGRSVAVVTAAPAPLTDVVIIGWPSIVGPELRTSLLAQSFDLVILDESHWAKNFEAKRTQACYGLAEGAALNSRFALVGRASRVWCLTGTPMPNSPFDLYPMLRFGAPDRLDGVLDMDTFKRRYCRIKPKRIGRGCYSRSIDVIVGGQNLDELRQRIAGLMLQRTQADVGITQPIYEILPLTVSARAMRDAENANAKAILAAIEAGETKELEMHLGPLRRITGSLKAKPVAEAISDEFAGGLDKIVLAYWHREVAVALREELAAFGVTGIDGSTPAAAREANVAAFSRPDGPKVFLAQIQAAGEAIDLSAANELLFVEMSFVPKDGTQMALRITNHTQTRQPRVRVAAVDGSIDEAIQTALLRKMQAIREVMQ